MTGRKDFLKHLKNIYPYTVGLPNGHQAISLQEGIVSLNPELHLLSVTSEPSQEYTLEPELEPETNEEPGNPTSVLEPDEPELGNSDDDEDHLEAQTQDLRDYQLSRDRFLIPLLPHVLCEFFCCCRR
ncbi:hypothetical protein M9H77_32165 [Catharanthus roseus]|uniref:Uncharacterized protein n=1 Tax=Catharanthus roseus TaxID=4058 RepID=A0ACC0A4K1_CATRO|nr:hypothetical protein M9H77_32165 [Catharanthus roseus]